MGGLPCKDMPVGPKGGPVKGAWVRGVLDLQGCESAITLNLYKCNLSETPVFADAQLQGISLSGCHLLGLSGHRLRVTHSVHFKDGFTSLGCVDLVSAYIGGQLVCSGGTFRQNEGKSLNCNAITVGASVMLNGAFNAKGEVNFDGAKIIGQFACAGGAFEVNAKSDSLYPLESDEPIAKALSCARIQVGASVLLCGGFSAKGLVDFSGAQIGGQFSCDNGRFDRPDITVNRQDNVVLDCSAMSVGAGVLLRENFLASGLVNFACAEVVGRLECINATFLGNVSFESLHVGEGLFWQGLNKAPNVLDLTDAHVGSLRDDKASWENCTPVLHGFRYDRIIGDMSVGQRLKWLARGWEPAIEPTVEMEWAVPKGAKKFDPQPYSQLAKILRAQGNAGGAVRVLVARGKRQAEAAYYSAQAALDGSWAAARPATLASFKRPIDGLFGLVFGYGHQPARALVAVFFIWLFSVALYGTTYDKGQMAPNSAVILTSTDWQDAAKKGCADIKQPDCTMPLRLWEASHTSTDYETFNRYLYALDLFVPLDALGQENAWAPSKDRGPWGYAAYSLRWVIQMLGWIITAVGAAALTGVIGKRD